MTTWGANFKDSPDPALLAKRINFRRALVCLSHSHSPPPDLGNVTVNFDSNGHHRRVELELVENPAIGGMILRIRAEGY